VYQTGVTRLMRPFVHINCRLHLTDCIRRIRCPLSPIRSVLKLAYELDQMV